MSTSSAASTASNSRRWARAVALAGAAALAAPVPAAPQFPDCAPAQPVEHAVIRHVIDGDTVIFNNGEHVRMVGIDTPELGADGAPDQPGAAEARDWLAALLPSGTLIAAAPDAENRDRHGRLLRHLYLPDGTNLQASLLGEGLATPLTIPPATRHLSCYRDAAAAAERAATGLWSRPEYHPLEPGALTPGTRGFRIVRSRVLDAGRSRGGIWLRLEEALSVIVPAASTAGFNDDFPGLLIGKFVEIRGMVYPRRGRLQMYLRHPLDLRFPHTEGNPDAPRASN